jgi:hypothetical protein
MARQKAVSKTESRELEPIAPNQQSLIEGLLSGKSISQAALAASISRRTATYWLADPEHPVYIEYEKQRIQQRQEFYGRIAALHDLALKAMEDALSPVAPPGIRFQAAKFLYEKHLQHLCGVQVPSSPHSLVNEQTRSVPDNDLFELLNEQKIDRLPD